MGKVSVRSGHTIAHFGSPADAAKYQLILDGHAGDTSSSHGGHNGVGAKSIEVSEAGSVLMAAQVASSRLLEALLVFVPGLTGRDTTSFSTALRSKAFRQILSVQSVRGLELLKVLQFVSDAADAARHLTPCLVHEAVDIAILALQGHEASDTDEAKSGGCSDSGISGEFLDAAVGTDIPMYSAKQSFSICDAEVDLCSGSCDRYAWANLVDTESEPESYKEASFSGCDFHEEDRVMALQSFIKARQEWREHCLDALASCSPKRGDDSLLAWEILLEGGRGKIKKRRGIVEDEFAVLDNPTPNKFVENGNLGTAAIKNFEEGYCWRRDDKGNDFGKDDKDNCDFSGSITTWQEGCAWLQANVVVSGESPHFMAMMHKVRELMQADKLKP